MTIYTEPRSERVRQCTNGSWKLTDKKSSILAFVLSWSGNHTAERYGGNAMTRGLAAEFKIIPIFRTTVEESEDGEYRAKQRMNIP